MSLSLNTIKPAVGATKRRKRVGRGNASGHGTTATKGTKGQKSRSGVSGLKKLGMRQVVLSTPKNRGFKSLAPKNQAVNLKSINLTFKEGETVDRAALLKAGLITSKVAPIKILNVGSLEVRKLVFVGVKMSDTARAQVEKTGGEVK